jgi:hypothetical protein
MVLKSIFGSDSAVKTLLFIENYGEGFCAEISSTYGVSASMIQKQLDKYEENGVLVAKKVGRSRLYLFNPRFYFLIELKALLRKALDSLPEKEVKKYYRNRKRPRRKGKAL